MENLTPSGFNHKKIILHRFGLIKTKPQNKGEDEIGRFTPSDWSKTAKRRPRRPAGLDLGFRLCLIVLAFNQNIKATT